MNQFMQNLERRFGRYAVQHLTMILVGCWVVGYALQAAGVTDYMTLDIYQILHGQVWRLITWIVIPPSSLSIWTIIMLLFYISIGNTLERAWGDFRYNVYLLGGMLLYIIAGFLTYFIMGAIYGSYATVGYAIGAYFSTYYIAFSMLLAYAATFPEATVYFMMFIPMKMKWLGWLYVILQGIDVITYLRYAFTTNPVYYIPVIAILVALLNFVLFYFSNVKRGVHLTREQREMRRQFRANTQNVQRRTSTTNPEDRIIKAPIARHRCEVCGRTEISNPELEFRYCTKCEGAHEYCTDHLYTHEHKHE